MYDKNYYPTPPHVIRTMIDKIGGIRSLVGKTILEPSAGMGAILDWITKEMSEYRRASNVLCFESSPDMAMTLAGKNYRVIGYDFLSEPCMYDVDYIIMNPPFDRGGAHLLRAWDTLKNGEIVCLLNAETYYNAYSRERQILNSIIHKHGTVSDLGNVFTDAARQTDVEVVMVHLKKTSDEIELNFGLDGFQKEDIQLPNLEDSTQLELLDPLMRKERRYTEAISLFKQATEALHKFKQAVQGIGGSYQEKEVYTAAWEGNFNKFYSYFNSCCWTALLHESKFERIMTSKVKEKFLSDFKNQQNLAFTVPNMQAMFSAVMYNVDTVMSDCLLEVFEWFCSFHKDNKIHVEGWKTNDAYKVNMKIVLPRHVEPTWGGSFRLNYTYRDKLRDIDRVMCSLTGKSMTSIVSIEKAIDTKCDELNNSITKGQMESLCESTFFKIRFFKKGTLHITFKDKLLWEWFNCKASELRGYPLPEAKDVYSKKANLLLIGN